LPRLAQPHANKTIFALSEALQELSSTRQTTILSAFLAALTQGGSGPSNLPRPIELHAHDPIRYVGDMLAWVHQTAAAEHEFLEGLFGMKEDRRMVGSIRQVKEGEVEVLLRGLMDVDLDKICMPLKVSSFH
jgi:conserved oligomeric Golgi complex subunit 6